MGRLWNGRYRIVFSVRNLGYISNWWLGSRRYRAAQCLPCLHQRGLEVKSFVNAHILSYSMNSPIISVDSSTILMMKVRCRHHQAYLSFDSFVRLIIFVSRNSASPSLSAARKAHSRAKIVIGSPMPPPTTVSMWKGCLVALRRNKMPQVAVKNRWRNFLSKRLRDFGRRRMKRKPTSLLFRVAYGIVFLQAVSLLTILTFSQCSHNLYFLRCPCQ